MSDPRDSQPPHKRPHPQPMAAPYLEFDLGREIDQLLQEAGAASDHNAKTLIKYGDFRVVLTVLRARGRIPSHHTRGRISIHVVRGHMHLRAEGRTFDLRAGSLVALDRGVAHDVDALEDSAFLITVVLPPKPRS